MRVGVSEWEGTSEWGEGGVWEGRWGISIPPRALRAQDEWSQRAGAASWRQRDVSAYVVGGVGVEGIFRETSAMAALGPGPWVSLGAEGETRGRQGTGLGRARRGRASGDTGGGGRSL